MSSLVVGCEGILPSWCCAVFGSSVIDKKLSVMSFSLFLLVDIFRSNKPCFVVFQIIILSGLSFIIFHKLIQVVFPSLGCSSYFPLSSCRDVVLSSTSFSCSFSIQYSDNSSSWLFKVVEKTRASCACERLSSPGLVRARGQSTSHNFPVSRHRMVHPRWHQTLTSYNLTSGILSVAAGRQWWRQPPQSSIHVYEDLAPSRVMLSVPKLATLPNSHQYPAPVLRMRTCPSVNCHVTSVSGNFSTIPHTLVGSYVVVPLCSLAQRANKGSSVLGTGTTLDCTVSDATFGGITCLLCEFTCVSCDTTCPSEREPLFALCRMHEVTSKVVSGRGRGSKICCTSDLQHRGTQLLATTDKPPSNSRRTHKGTHLPSAQRQEERTSKPKLPFSSCVTAPPELHLTAQTAKRNNSIKMRPDQLDQDAPSFTINLASTMPIRSHGLHSHREVRGGHRSIHYFKKTCVRHAG